MCKITYNKVVINTGDIPHSNTYISKTKDMLISN